MTTSDRARPARPYVRPTRSFFPHPSRANRLGVVAVGAEPHAELLVDAYSHGIFPWPHEGMPLLWFSPDPRFVLDPRRAHVPRSLKKAMKKTRFEIRADTRFEDVIAACGTAFRPGQRGTWITPAMRDGYLALHEAGLAHSIETFVDGELVGGFYGISLGAAFFGESMFAQRDDASKIAFATFIAQSIAWDFAFIDCQSYTDHLARFGAENWPRTRFLAALDDALTRETRQGAWTLSVAPTTALPILDLHVDDESV